MGATKKQILKRLRELKAIGLDVLKNSDKVKDIDLHCAIVGAASSDFAKSNADMRMMIAISPYQAHEAMEAQESYGYATDRAYKLQQLGLEDGINNLEQLASAAEYYSKLTPRSLEIGWIPLLAWLDIEQTISIQTGDWQATILEYYRDMLKPETAFGSLLAEYFTLGRTAKVRFDGNRITQTIPATYQKRPKPKAKLILESKKMSISSLDPDPEKYSIVLDYGNLFKLYPDRKKLENRFAFPKGVAKKEAAELAKELSELAYGQSLSFEQAYIQK